MRDGIDRTDKISRPAFETLTIAYHQAGHAVARLRVFPPLPLAGATLVPVGDDLGVVTFEDYIDLLPAATNASISARRSAWPAAGSHDAVIELRARATMSAAVRLRARCTAA